jgi:hypothetical protein
MHASPFGRFYTLLRTSDFVNPSSDTELTGAEKERMLFIKAGTSAICPQTTNRLTTDDEIIDVGFLIFGRGLPCVATAKVIIDSKTANL